MTQAEKRVAIATDRGWRCLCGHDWIAPGEPLDAMYSQSVPDYFTDYAAAVDLWDALASPTLRVIVEKRPNGWNVKVKYMGIEVTAPTFPVAVAEAYGRARNLWKE